MPVPKRKTSKRRRDQRAAGKRKVCPAMALCQTCHKPTRPHQVCVECGYYKGIKVLRTKEERLQEREVARQLKSRPLGTTPEQDPNVIDAQATPVESDSTPSEK